MLLWKRGCCVSVMLTRATPHTYLHGLLLTVYVVYAPTDTCLAMCKCLGMHLTSLSCDMQVLTQVLRERLCLSALI